MTNAGDSEDFIADAERHNEWWSGDTSPDLTRAIAFPARSDLHGLLRGVDKRSAEGNRSVVYPIFGQTGIGKTTMLLQFVGAIRNDLNAFSDKDDEIIDSVQPRQVLYLPLEDSLYHLERPEDALARLHDVVDYFRSHVAPRKGRKYVILDDVGALNLPDERRSELLEIVENDTYLLLSGFVGSQVDFAAGDDDIDAVLDPIPVLPMKFVDTLKHASRADNILDNITPEFGARIESYQSTNLDGPAPLKDIRTALGEGDVEAAVDTLDTLYFDVFSEPERDDLHDAARSYLRTGGSLNSVEDPWAKNELERSNYLLYLYKELAGYESIQQPQNLHRLSSIAASRAGEELRYTDISDQIGVDRRTIDTYLDALNDGLAVTESHDFSLRRYRRTRLYLRNPRHAVLLSRREEHHGFERPDDHDTLNYEFEYTLARTVAFDHARRLAYPVGSENVEYCPTDTGMVDYVLNNEGLVLPFVLSYHPYAGDALTTATAFDPTDGQHTKPDGEDLYDYDYAAPYRFIITDNLPKDVREKESLVVEHDDKQVCYLPFWLFLLVC